MPVRFDEADGKAFFNAAVFEIDLATKRTESVRAIQLF
jgi:calcineurin-like phosphoesterase